MLLKVSTPRSPEVRGVTVLPGEVVRSVATRAAALFGRPPSGSYLLSGADEVVANGDVMVAERFKDGDSVELVETGGAV